MECCSASYALTEAPWHTDRVTGRSAARMLVHRRSETVRVVPQGTARLVATTIGVDLGRRQSRLGVARVGPHHVEVEHRDGRVDVVRTRDLDRWARVAILLIGAVARRYIRQRRSNR